MSQLCRTLAGFCVALTLTAAAFANEPPPGDTSAVPPAETSASEASDAQAATPGETESATRAAMPPADTSSGQSAAAAKPDTAKTAELENDPVICKRFQPTGTRLRKTKVCRLKSEWRQTELQAKELMKKNDRRTSPQTWNPPGG